MPAAKNSSGDGSLPTGSTGSSSSAMPPQARMPPSVPLPHADGHLQTLARSARQSCPFSLGTFSGHPNFEDQVHYSFRGANHMTQCMVRPRVARRFQRAGGKRSCINVSGLWLEAMLRAIMDISAPVTSLADRPWTGHLGHQFSQAPGRPNLHLVSFSRRPRQVSYYAT
jgi:hypothetical protein